MYIEGDVPYMTNGNYNNGAFGGDGIWAIALLALLFGWGRGGYGSGYGSGGGSEVLGYELGRVATTNDVASGFSTSAIMSDLNDIKLGQAQMQNWINQGFVGVDRSILTGFHGVDNALCTLGYQNQQGFNSLSRELAECCCKTQQMIERQTCDLITNSNMNTQRIMDHLYYKELESVKSERDDYKLMASQAKQTSQIIGALNPTPVPSYNVPNPNCCYAPYGYSAFGWGGNCGSVL